MYGNRTTHFASGTVAVFQDDLMTSEKFNTCLSMSSNLKLGNKFALTPSSWDSITLLLLSIWMIKSDLTYLVLLKVLSYGFGSILTEIAKAAYEPGYHPFYK